MKKCCSCKEIKHLTFFNKNKTKIDGYTNQCKNCRSIYREKNKIKIQEYRDQYYNIDRSNIQVKNNYKSFKERYDNDELFKIRHKIRDLIRKSITSNNYTKKSKTYNILGCTYTFFKAYIEFQFTKEMNWTNIHLDHIYPVSLAKTEKEILELNHYTNFQPLLSIDNIKKSNKIINNELRFI